MGWLYTGYSLIGPTGFTGYTGYTGPTGPSPAGKFVNPIAIGTGCGQISQSNNSVAIGYFSGYNSQGANSVAIGYQCGQTGQGTYCVAIGANAGSLNQANSSIVLNASSTNLTSSSTGFFVSPLRNTLNTTSYLMMYDNSTKEVWYSGAQAGNSSKTFVIQHPTEQEKYLVHACLEGPESGVYYRGEGHIIQNNICEIILPKYTDKLAKNWTVNLTVKTDNWITNMTNLQASEVKNGRFKVFGENDTKFYWTAYGTRCDIEVEIDKKEHVLCGDGPYTYVNKR